MWGDSGKEVFSGLVNDFDKLEALFKFSGLVNLGLSANVLNEYRYFARALVDNQRYFRDHNRHPVPKKEST